MKFNFKKIASVLAGTVMLSSTLAFAAAANNYPSPFVKSGSADVAVVYGSNPGAEFDLLAVADITQSLSEKLAAQTAVGGTTSGTVSVSGEATPLFSGSSKIYINDTLNSIKNVVTKSEMPVLLAEQSFSGNVDAKTTQTITLGSNPQITFAKQPTSSDDPTYALTTSSSTGTYIYNATIDFNKAVNFTHADTKNQELTMFGQKFTVGAGTTASDLILLKSASKINFDSSGTTSEEVTIEGKKYTVEMVSASATAATIKVTNEAGATEQKEITEGYSKKVNGLTIAVNTADSNNLKYTASVVAGAEKVTLTSGSSVTYGDSATVIDGTLVTFSNADLSTTTTKLTFSVRASNSDKDAIKSGASFVDPIFGTFKVDFPGLSTTDNSTAREEIKVQNSGDDKMTVSATDARGNAKTIQYAMNRSDSLTRLQWDSDGHIIRVAEKVAINKSDYVVVGNEAEGRLMKVTTITNQTTGYSNDKITFTDVFDGTSVDAALTNDGVGTVPIGGKVYDVNYYGDNALSDDAKTIRIGYPDSSSNDMIVYPTMSTSKGAKLFFYEPLTINLGNWDGSGNTATAIKFPNCANAYQSITVGTIGGTGTSFNISSLNVTASTAQQVAITGTGFTYNFTYSAANTTIVYLVANDGADIRDPAIVLCEEKDDNNEYKGLIISLEEGRTGDDGIGVNDVIMTWHNDARWDAISLASDSKKSKDADLWGTIALIDSSDSDQKSATISYPDEQVYAQLYVAANAATLTSTGATSTGGTVKSLGSVSLTDTQVTQATGKNLIVVGGSCVNTLASTLLGGAGCGTSWETATGVGAGAFLVQSFDRTGGKVATLVAGYNAADTRNAAKVLVSDATLDLSAGKKYKSTSATSVQLVTTAATTATNTTA